MVTRGGKMMDLVELIRTTHSGQIFYQDCLIRFALVLMLSLLFMLISLKPKGLAKVCSLAFPFSFFKNVVWLLRKFKEMKKEMEFMFFSVQKMHD
jgi:hypothetical protein